MCRIVWENKNKNIQRQTVHKTELKKLLGERSFKRQKRITMNKRKIDQLKRDRDAVQLRSDEQGQK